MVTARSPQQQSDTLYVPVQQVGDVPPYTHEYLWIDPETAQQWLDENAQDDEFRNRPTNRADIGRMALIMKGKRFVHFLPVGPLCFDDKDILLNGKTRLNAVVESGETAVFVVYRNVPRWMFDYMDTNRVKTHKDVLYASYRMDKPSIIAAMKRVFLYEEVLFANRPATGWRSWSKERFQSADLNKVAGLRSEVTDHYGNAMAVRRGCGLQVTSLMLFHFYQWHAWPEGRERLEEFLDGLREGISLGKGSPALILRNWGRDDYCPSEGRIEMQLILLMQHFAAFVQGERMTKVVWAYGHEMPAPYHPDGPEAAKNALRAVLTPLNTTAE